MHPLEHRAGECTSLAGAKCQLPVDLGGITGEQLVTLLQRPEELDHRLGNRRLERAVPRARELLFGRRARTTGRGGVDVEQIRDARLLVAVVAARRCPSR